MFSQKAGKLFGLLGLLALVLCLGLVAYSEANGMKDESQSQCNSLSAKLNTPDVGKDGKLRVLGVSPPRTATNRAVCVVVAGVSAKVEENATPVDLSLFMNEVPAPQITLKA